MTGASAPTMPAPAAPPAGNTLAGQLTGNCFGSPALEYLLIGSVWSIAVVVLLLLPPIRALLDSNALLFLLVVGNSAHFAASTVRLYTKPSFRDDYPFLYFVFPLITLGVLAACVALPETLGRNLWSLFLTWSPYHYAAQAYGLSVMYSARSGFRFGKPEQRLLFWICLLPFFYTMAKTGLVPTDAGLGWVIPEAVLQRPFVAEGLRTAKLMLGIATFVLPVAWYAWHSRAHQKPLPLMPLVIMASNGLWWITLDFMQAFTLATIAHGLQYLAISVIFHSREKVREPGNTRPAWQHGLQFYGYCLVLGYALFYCWPYAFQAAGAGLAQSMMMVVATINLHHFIVDRYIWKLRGTSNTKTMSDQQSSTAAGPAPSPLPT